MIVIKEKIGKEKYTVECDCGVIQDKYYGNLIKSHNKGNIVSCGCKRGDNISNKLIGKENHRKIHFTKEQEQEMIRLFNERVNLRKIGDIFGVTNHVIKNVLKKYNIKPKQRRHDVNEEYFDVIDTEEKSYWLGFLGADGCIRRRVNDKNGKTRGDSIALKLSVLDEEHMIRFKNQICPDAKITYHTNRTMTKKGNLSISNTCNLVLCGNKLVQGAIKQGLVPRKTFVIERPPIEEKYYRHYIRGFFDGDGCAYIQHRDGRNLLLKYSIACASIKLKDFFKEQLDKLNIEYYEDTLSIYLRKHTDQFKFYHYMYDDSTVYLKRKKDKGDEFIEFFNMMSKREDSFEGKHSYDINYPTIIRDWSNEEIKILYDTNNKIPYTYLSRTLLPNKSKSQINRMRKKLGIVSDNRKIVGYLKIRKELKGT